jgi:hypothetical protein
MRILQDSVEKAAYAVRMMRLARWISGQLADDYEARVVGRMVLVFAPIYVECAFRLLKRPGGLSEPDRRELRAAVCELRDDFEEFYERIRNDLSAHRDVLDLDLAIEAWNEIDSDTLLWFCAAADESLADIAARHTMMMGSPVDFDAMDDEGLARKLATPLPRDGALRFSTDALALTRGHSGFIPVHPVQDAASVLMSIRTSLDVCYRVNELARGRISLHLLLKTMFVNDTMNLIDNLYGPAVGASDKRSASMLRIMEEGSFAGAGELAAALTTLDMDAVRTVRGLRNRACAHLDPNIPLTKLQHMVLELDDEVLVERVLNPSWAALEAACAADFSTRWLLMDEVSLYGLRPASTPGVRAFDREP